MSAVYNALLDRAETQALMPEEVRRDIIDGIAEKSFVLTRLERQRMSRMQTRMPVLDRLPMAYFVNGDTGIKQTTDMKWDNLYLNAEEIAVLLVVPNNVVNDSAYDLYDLIRPRLTEAAGAKVDAAVLFGTDKPTTWPAGLQAGATAAGHTVTQGGTAGEDVFSDMNKLMMFLEADGYTPDLWVLRPQAQGIIRNTRDAQKGFLYPAAGPSGVGGQNAGFHGEIWGVPSYVSRMGLSGFATNAANAQAFLLDTDHIVVGIRDDIDFEVFKTGVVSDAAGVVLINLMQQDSQAIRLTFRLAWQVLNPATRQEPTRANRYPAAVLLQGTAGAIGFAALPEGEQQALPPGSGGEQPAITETAAGTAGTTSATTRTTTAAK